MYALRGAAGLELAGHQYHCGRLDSSAGGRETVWSSRQGRLCFYIRASVDEGYGTPFSVLLICICLWVRFIRFTERAWTERGFVTLNQEIQASRLIAGPDLGGNSAWTS